MKKCLASLWMLNLLTIAATLQAADLKQSKVTEVVNDVQIISAADQAQKTAVVNDLFQMPDILRTGPASRAELVAADDTVTRVGANTIFSFDPASRTVDLKQGSLLFHSPHGQGGGSIHTGSATASVLGSTLIVCATPNGGFKVICLEDGAQIKLKNGLKQQLTPGQMTYILPGASKLAPVILFRLDDLIVHSLLVKGFIHPLPSLPLIDREVDKQTKLIKSGRATDTGLLAGNNASANQVEVLDANTVQPVVTPEKSSLTAVQTALKTDATLDQSSVTDPAIPTPPQRIFLGSSFTLAGNNFFAGRSFQGFAGHDINFSAPNQNGLNVDLSSYTSAHEFDFVASGDVNLASSVNFTGLTSQNRLFVIGGGQINLSPNITLQADAGDFELVTPGALTINGGSVINNLGDIAFTSGSTINLLNGYILNPGSMTFTAKNGINIIWTSEVTITGDNYLNTTAGDGQVTLSSINGYLAVDKTSVKTHTLTLNSGDRILLDASGRTLTGTGSGASANFSAPNLIEVKNADFSTFGVVNMAANTITLNGVTFGANSTDNFGTQTGQVNVNGTQIPGGVNFYNSHYGATAITSASQINLSSGPGSTPGLYSYATGH